MELRLDGAVVGALGQVSRRVAEAFDIKQPVWFGELDLSLSLRHPHPSVRAQSASPFPPVKRDLSLVVDQAIPYAQLLETIRAQGTPLAHQIELIDRYTGAKIPAQQHSLTFSITYRDPARTLASDEVDRVHGQIRDELARRFSATLR